MSEAMTIPPMPRYDESCRDWIDCVRNLEAWGTQGWAEVQALRAKLEEAESALDGLDLNEWPGGVGEIEAAYGSNLAFRLKAEAERDAAMEQIKELGIALVAARADAEKLAYALDGCVKELEEVIKSAESETAHFDGDDFHERLTAGMVALAQHREGR